MATPGTPAAMLQRIRQIRLEEEVGDILEQNLEELKQMNIAQMMQGRNNKGELFSPRHSENPFFKTPEKGLAYARWKQRLYPETPFDIANFTIVGYYHGSISFSRNADQLVADASASFAKNIDQEFNNSTLGLNPDSKEKAWEEIIRSPLLHTLADKIGCDVK